MPTDTGKTRALPLSGHRPLSEEPAEDLSDFVWLYELRDPRCGSVRYYGKTKSPQGRRRQHRAGRNPSTREWALGLQAVGLEPVMVTIHHGPLDEVLRLEANLIYEESRKGVPLLNVQHHSGAAPKYSAPDTEKARLELQLEMAEMSRESLMVIIECQRKTIRAQASILGWALE